MRLVSKSVQVNRDEKGRPVSVATPVTSNAKEWDRSWFNFAFVLIEEKDMNNGNDRTTLLCFDAPPTLLKEFNDLKLAEAQQNDAYFILTIILQELFRVMDNVAWTLADVFRGVEKVYNIAHQYFPMLTSKGHARKDGTRQARRKIDQFLRASQHLKTPNLPIRSLSSCSIHDWRYISFI